LRETGQRGKRPSGTKMWRPPLLVGLLPLRREKKSIAKWAAVSERKGGEKISWHPQGGEEGGQDEKPRVMKRDAGTRKLRSD